MSTKKTEKKPKGPIANGQTVKWCRLGGIEKKGIVLAFVPAGTSTRQALAAAGVGAVVSLGFSDIPGQYPNYVIEVKTPGAKGKPPRVAYFTPQADMVDRQNPRAKRA